MKDYFFYRLYYKIIVYKEAIKDYVAKLLRKNELQRCVRKLINKNLLALFFLIL